MIFAVLGQIGICLSISCSRLGDGAALAFRRGLLGDAQATSNQLNIISFEEKSVFWNCYFSIKLHYCKLYCAPGNTAGHNGTQIGCYCSDSNCCVLPSIAQIAPTDLQLELESVGTFSYIRKRRICFYVVATYTNQTNIFNQKFVEKSRSCF